MTFLTTVRDITTGMAYTYTLSPKKALVAAYYQYGLKNWDTWTYKAVAEFDFTETDKRITIQGGRFYANKQAKGVTPCSPLKSPKP